MAKAVKVTIELEYYKEDIEFVIGEELTDEGFVEYVEESAHEDLWDLIRGNDINTWATIEVIE